MPRIFISYRRDDSAAHAGRLYDRLEGHFGRGQVFMDVDAIKPGLDFVEVVQQAVSVCDGLVAVIGREWLEASDIAGVRRLDDPADLVRIEIATALERGIRVIPVLVQGAQMPRATDLPQNLTSLANRNAQEISDTRFRVDVDRLIEGLETPTSEPLADGVFVEPPPVASSSAGSSAGSSFVGRERELVDLKELLADAVSGRGRLVTLAGEPGIGKTRTAQELAAQAEALGAQVLWGWCYEEEGAPPFWPWVQLLGAYTQQASPQQLVSEMGPGAADIAEIVPQIRGKLPDLVAPPSLEPEQARFRLFQSITTFLNKSAQSHPMMLVLDDLHWADQPSLLLLQFLARQMAESRLLVVGTYRDVELSRQHPLSETLAQLTRQPVFRREFLRGLSQEDTQHFIEATTGIVPHRGLVDTIYAHTEGNPFFMIEVVRLLSERGELTANLSSAAQGELVEHIQIPQGVREVIGQRLNRLSEQCNRVLSTAAVMGREFNLEHIFRLVDDLSEDRLLEVLEECLEALVIEELTGKAGSYQFTQHLIQETLLTELSTTRRGRLHGRIAEMLEGFYGSAAESHASELAYHYAGALTATGGEKLAHYSRLAGEQALAIHAHEEALIHFERALTAREKQPTDAEAAALWFGLGRTQGATGKVNDAWTSLRRAFDYYFEAGDVAEAVAVADYPLLYVSGLEQATEMVERALTLVPPDSLEAGYLLSRYGLLVNLETGDYPRVQEAFARALVIAQLEKDPVLEMRTRGAAADVDTYHLRWPAVLENSLRAIELAAQVGDPLAEVWPRYSATTALLVLGDPQTAASHAEAMLKLAEEVRNRDLMANALYVNATTAYVKGDWQASREFSDRALDLVPQLFIVLQLRSLMEYQVGEFGEGKLYLERLLEVMRQTPPGPTGEYISVAWLIPIVAYITGVTDQFAIAEAAANTVLSSPSATPLAMTYSRLGLSLIAVLKGDPVPAGEFYLDLQSGKGEMLAGDYGSGDRFLGLLARTAGRLDQAIGHFADALTFCRKGYRHELAWTCWDYADTLLQRDEPGDRDKAMSLLEESLAISTELGMRPLMERVLSRRDLLMA